MSVKPTYEELEQRVQELEQAESELDRAKSALREREELHRKLIEFSPLPFVVTQNEKIVFANPAALKLFGAEHQDEIIGSSPKGWTHPDCTEQAYQRRSQAIEAGKSLNPVELRLVTRDKKEAVVIANATAISHHGASALLSVFTDVTAQKQVEQALSESEERYRIIVESSGEDIWQLDLNGNVIYASPAVEKIFGYTPKEALQLDMSAFFLESDLVNATKAFSRAVAGEAYQLLEFDGLRKDGSTVPIEVSVTPMVKDGSIIGVQGIARDITHRKEIEAKLNEALLWYQEMFEGSKDAIFISNENAEFIAVNESACRLTGFSRDDLLSMRIPDLHEEADLNAYRKYHSRIMAGEAITSEAKILHKDGTKVDAEFSNRAIAISDKTYMHTTARDITERKRAEKQLIESNLLLDATGRMARVGGWEVDAETLEVNWTEETYRIHEVPPDYKPPLEEAINFFHPDDQQRLSQAIQRALEDGSPYDMELRLITSNGNELWTRTMCQPEMVDGRVVKLRGTFQDITERKRAEHKLRDSEERYRRLAENSPAVVYQLRMDKGGEFTFPYISEALNETMGVSPKAAMENASRLLEMVHPEDRERFYSGVIQSADSLQPYHDTFRCLKDGEVIWIEARSVPENLPGGDIFWDGFFLDNTLRKEAEEALRESEAKFSALVSQAPVALFLHDSRGRIVEVNQTTLDNYGYTREELLQMKASDIDPDFVEREDGGAFWKKLKGKGYFSFDARHLHKDGTTFPVNVRLAPIVLEGRKHLFALAMDMSEYKKVEAALKSSEEKFSKAFQNAPLLMSITSLEDGRYLEVNDAFLQLTGYTREEALGKTSKDLGVIAAEERNGLPSLLQPEKRLRDYEIEVTCKDGSKRNCLYSGEVIEYEGKTRLLSIALDITERRRMQAEREKLQGQLRQAQKMESIGTLAGGIAHDFNNILSPLMIHAEMVLMDLPSDSPLQMHVKQMYQASERARDLVKQILTFARKQESSRAPIKVSLMVKEVAKFLRSTIPTTIDIQYHIHTEQDLVLGDPTELNQLLINLSTNSAHAMEEGGGSLIISVRNETFDTQAAERFSDLEPGSFVVMSVKDTGQGIDHEILDKIFEPYFTTKETGKGTGIGLAVVHGIVKSYGGDITVDSELGRGTCFNVYLPQVQENGNKTELNKEPLQLPKGHERILFVDDEETVMGAVRPMLEALGYSVTAKRSSVEALAAFTEDPGAFDLIITDQTMPEMTGKELARRILAIRPELPIILCTGYSPQIDEKRAKAMGIQGFVMKPIVMKEIANTIREVLGSV